MPRTGYLIGLYFLLGRKITGPVVLNGELTL